MNAASAATVVIVSGDMRNLVTLVLLGVPVALLVLAVLTVHGIFCRGRGHVYGQPTVVELTHREPADVVVVHDAQSVMGRPEVIYDEWSTGRTKVVRRCVRCGVEQPPDAITSRAPAPVSVT